MPLEYINQEQTKKEQLKDYRSNREVIEQVQVMGRREIISRPSDESYYIHIPGPIARILGMNTYTKDSFKCVLLRK